MASALNKTPQATQKSPSRDSREMDQYKKAQENIKKYTYDSPEYKGAAKRLETIGAKYGLKWQQWIPKGSNNQPPPIGADVRAEDAAVGNVGSDLLQQMGGYAAQFNPATFQQQYEPQFNEQMNRAYNAVYDQFNRRNQGEFARQNQEFQQSMAERGLDPNSEAYKTLSKQMTDRQDLARQEAQNAATQQAYAVNQQGYEQATGASLLGGQIANQYAAPYMAQYGTRAAMDIASQQNDYAKELAALDFKYKQKLQQSAPRGGGGGGGGTDYFGQYVLNTLGQNYAPQGSSPSYANAGIQGGAAGFGNAFMNYLNQLPKKGS